MTDISVNINGRDNGLGDKLKKLREEVKGIANDVNRLPTEKKIDIRQTVQTDYQNQKQAKQKEYEDARTANKAEYSEAQKQRQAGKMSPKDFESQQKAYMQSSSDLNKEEKDELAELDRQQVTILRQMFQQMRETNQLAKEREKADTNQKQRELDGTPSSSEAGSGSGGGIRAMGRRAPGGPSTYGKDSGGGKVLTGNPEMDGKIEQIGKGIDSVGGELGMATGAVRGIAAVAGGTAAVVIAVAAVAAMGVKASFDLKEQEMKLNATRAFGGGGVNGLDKMSKLMHMASPAMSGMDIEMGDFVGRMGEVQKTSLSGKNLGGRAFETFGAEKAYGLENATQYMTLDRQFKEQDGNQKTSIDVMMDMLNTLTQINNSSLKEDDLTTLGEKMGIIGKLNAQQLAYSNQIDTNKSMRLMAAAETSGVSKMGVGQGAFYEKLESGSKAGSGTGMRDLMMNQMATQFDPSLASDPIALKRFVNTGGGARGNEWKAFQMKQLGGIKNKTIRDMTTIGMMGFGAEDWANKDQYDAMRDSPEAMKILGGKGALKQGTSFDKKAMYKEAKEVNTNELSSLITEIKNGFTTTADQFTDMFRSGDYSAPTKSSKQTIPSNKVKK